MFILRAHPSAPQFASTVATDTKANQEIRRRFWKFLELNAELDGGLGSMFTRLRMTAFGRRDYNREVAKKNKAELASVCRVLLGRTTLPVFSEPFSLLLKRERALCTVQDMLAIEDMDSLAYGEGLQKLYYGWCFRNESTGDNIRSDACLEQALDALIAQKTQAWKTGEESRLNKSRYIQDKKTATVDALKFQSSRDAVAARYFSTRDFWDLLLGESSESTTFLLTKYQEIRSLLSIAAGLDRRRIVEEHPMHKLKTDLLLVEQQLPVAEYRGAQSTYVEAWVPAEYAYAARYLSTDNRLPNGHVLPSHDATGKTVRSIILPLHRDQVDFGTNADSTDASADDNTQTSFLLQAAQPNPKHGKTDLGIAKSGSAQNGTASSRTVLFSGTVSIGSVLPLNSREVRGGWSFVECDRFNQYGSRDGYYYGSVWCGEPKAPHKTYKTGYIKDLAGATTSLSSPTKNDPNDVVDPLENVLQRWNDASLAKLAKEFMAMDIRVQNLLGRYQLAWAETLKYRWAATSVRKQFSLEDEGERQGKALKAAMGDEMDDLLADDNPVCPSKAGDANSQNSDEMDVDNASPALSSSSVLTGPPELDDIDDDTAWPATRGRGAQKSLIATVASTEYGKSDFGKALNTLVGADLSGAGASGSSLGLSSSAQPAAGAKKTLKKEGTEACVRLIQNLVMLQESGALPKRDAKADAGCYVGPGTSLLAQMLFLPRAGLRGSVTEDDLLHALVSASGEDLGNGADDQEFLSAS